MNIDKTHMILYLYVVGILMSGVFLERLMAPFGRFAVLGGVLVGGLLWLKYYQLGIAPRIEYVLNQDEEESHSGLKP